MNFDRVNAKVDTQIATELYYNKKAIWERIEGEIDREPQIMECMFQATRGITEWAQDFNGYDSKCDRLEALLEHNDIGLIVRKAMVLVLMLDERRDLLTSIAGQLRGSIKGMEDHKAGVVTAGEILTLMCDYDCFDMDHSYQTIVDEESGIEYTTKSWYIENPWELSKATSKHIKRGMYLPPMIVHPRKLTKNTDSAYITIERDSVILGKANHHDGEACLDSLNRFNAIPLSMNVQFIKSVDTLMMDATADMTDETKRQYEKFMDDSYYVFAMMVKADNKFWLSHKVDKRGRTYAQGYHASTQGNAFRKAAIELNTKQIVTGEF